ncbi:MAG TPA: hypothetical protein VEP48_05705 [Methylomirabilota bacterium]|nr:hypothetical protein [Methylomirabilota bacterium]
MGFRGPARPLEVLREARDVEDTGSERGVPPAEQHHTARDADRVRAYEIAVHEHAWRRRERLGQTGELADPERLECREVLHDGALDRQLGADDVERVVTCGGAGVDVLDQHPWSERHVRRRDAARMHARHPVGLAGEERQELRLGGVPTRRAVEDRARVPRRGPEPQAFSLPRRRRQDLDVD